MQEALEKLLNASLTPIKKDVHPRCLDSGSVFQMNQEKIFVKARSNIKVTFIR